MHADVEGRGFGPQLPLHPGPDLPLVAGGLLHDDKKHKHQLRTETLTIVLQGKQEI